MKKGLISATFSVGITVFLYFLTIEVFNLGRINYFLDGVTVLLFIFKMPIDFLISVLNSLSIDQNTIKQVINILSHTAINVFLCFDLPLIESYVLGLVKPYETKNEDINYLEILECKVLTLKYRFLKKCQPFKLNHSYNC